MAKRSCSLNEGEPTAHLLEFVPDLLLREFDK